LTVRVLGSGASEGIPAFLCNCPICARAGRRRGREIRLNACAYVESCSGKGILIDMPPSVKAAWDRHKLDHNRLLAVLLSHYHSDHTHGLRYLLEAIADNGYQSAHRVDLYLPADAMVKAVQRLYPDRDFSDGSWDGRFFSLHPTAAYRPLSLGPFEVTPLETNHLKRNRGDGSLEGETFGYLFRDADGKRLAYLLDAQVDMPEATYKALGGKPLDCLIFECSFARLDPPYRHTDLAGIVAVQRRLKPRLMVASHISHRALGHRELQKALRPHGIRVAFDGMLLRL
jgi:phosphoribosyl 1,2-cyclic phosphate phosphodiesterase